jgi:hypothetical protein
MSRICAFTVLGAREAARLDNNHALGIRQGDETASASAERATDDADPDHHHSNRASLMQCGRTSGMQYRSMRGNCSIPLCVARWQRRDRSPDMAVERLEEVSLGRRRQDLDKLLPVVGDALEKPSS